MLFLINRFCGFSAAFADFNSSSVILVSSGKYVIPEAWYVYRIDKNIQSADVFPTSTIISNLTTTTTICFQIIFIGHVYDDCE